jgi:hypothetical protein
VTTVRSDDDVGGAPEPDFGFDDPATESSSAD